VLESTADDVVLVLTTLGADINAVQLATTLVEERLAACVNVLPEMDSVFRWQGAVERDSERQLVIKTTRGQVLAVQACIAELHSYELPEFMVLAVADGSTAYLGWVQDQVTSKPEV
jgi:periplasmic divalent cation tolerance protein